MLLNKEMERIESSGKCVVFLVYFSLFLDNMLLTSVVPIIPDVLYNIENESGMPNTSDGRNESNKCTLNSINCSNFSNDSLTQQLTFLKLPRNIANENQEVGILFSSKALVQLAMNPIVGPLTNRIGCSTSLLFGAIVLFVSSLIFAYGKTYAALFAARSIHGIGSACICVAGMALIADRYQDERSRSQMMGITMGGMAAGVLVGYPLGGVLYDFVSRSAPLLTIAFLLVIDSALLFMFFRPRFEPERLLVGTSIRVLLMDPYVLLASGAIFVSTFSMAVLEPCLPIWLMESISPPKWQLGTVFIPDSLGYLIGTNCFGVLAFRIGRWITAMISLLAIGVCAIMIPLSTNVLQLVVPHLGLGLGIGVIDASLMPLLAQLVDTRYVALYGSVFAIAQGAVCLAYTFGPLLGGYLVKSMGFPWLIRSIGIINLLFSPFCYFLKDISSTKEESMVLNPKIPPEPPGSEPTAAAREAYRTGYASFANHD